jgi:hypothetical protein
MDELLLGTDIGSRARGACSCGPMAPRSRRCSGSTRSRCRDALPAAIGVGLVLPETDWATTADIVAPNAENAEVYAETFGLYDELYPATKDIVHRLVALQRRDGH